MTIESSLRVFETKETSPSGTLIDTQDGKTTKSKMKRMPTADDVLERRGIIVLRDTGCNSVILTSA